MGETSESCVEVTVKSCKPVATDDCEPTEFLIPKQEFVHQDKCLFDPSGNAHHGGDYDHDHHHHEEEEIDIVIEDVPEVVEDEVIEDHRAEAIEEVVVDESPVEAEVGYRNLAPEIPLNANLSPQRQSRSHPVIFNLRNKLFNGYNPAFNNRNFYRGA